MTPPLSAIRFPLAERVSRRSWSAVVSTGVVGNPPYERIQTMDGNAPKLVEFLKANYQSAAAGNFDIYVCFIERGLHLLSPNGTFGYICPNKFFQTEYGRGLRKLLSDGKHVRKVVSFGDLQVFPQVSTYTCLLFLSKEGLGSTDYSLVGNIDTFAATEALAQGFAVKAESLSESPWNFYWRRCTVMDEEDPERQQAARRSGGRNIRGPFNERG